MAGGRLTTQCAGRGVGGWGLRGWICDRIDVDAKGRAILPRRVRLTDVRLQGVLNGGVVARYACVGDVGRIVGRLEASVQYLERQIEPVQDVLCRGAQRELALNVLLLHRVRGWEGARRGRER